MKKQFFLFILSSFSLITAFAQNKPYALQIVKDLGSPEMHGRGYVKKGDRIAADYIREGFKKHSVVGLGNDYFQYFNFNINVQPSKMSLSLGDDLLVPGADYLITPNSPSVKGSYRVKRCAVAVKMLRRIRFFAGRQSPKVLQPIFYYP